MSHRRMTNRDELAEPTYRKCRECDWNVTTKNETCPYCGSVYPYLATSPFPTQNAEFALERVPTGNQVDAVQSGRKIRHRRSQYTLDQPLWLPPAVDITRWMPPGDLGKVIADLVEKDALGFTVWGCALVAFPPLLIIAIPIAIILLLTVAAIWIGAWGLWLVAGMFLCVLWVIAAAVTAPAWIICNIISVVVHLVGDIFTTIFHLLGTVIKSPFSLIKQLMISSQQFVWRRKQKRLPPPAQDCFKQKEATVRQHIGHYQAELQRLDQARTDNKSGLASLSEEGQIQRRKNDYALEQAAKGIQAKIIDAQTFFLKVDQERWLNQLEPIVAALNTTSESECKQNADRCDELKGRISVRLPRKSVISGTSSLSVAEATKMCDELRERFIARRTYLLTRGTLTPGDVNFQAQQVAENVFPIPHVYNRISAIMELDTAFEDIEREYARFKAAEASEPEINGLFGS